MDIFRTTHLRAWREKHLIIQKNLISKETLLSVPPTNSILLEVHWVLGGCLTWHFPVNLLEHSPIPVSGAVNTLRSENQNQASLVTHPSQGQDVTTFLMRPFSGHLEIHVDGLRLRNVSGGGV